MRRFRTPRLVVIAIGLFIALGQPASAAADEVVTLKFERRPVLRAAALELDEAPTVTAVHDTKIANPHASAPKVSTSRSGAVFQLGSAHMKVTATATGIQIGIGAKF